MSSGQRTTSPKLSTTTRHVLYIAMNVWKLREDEERNTILDPHDIRAVDMVGLLGLLSCQSRQK